jgi:hypothetical protein
VHANAAAVATGDECAGGGEGDVLRGLVGVELRAAVDRDPPLAAGRDPQAPVRRDRDVVREERGCDATQHARSRGVGDVDRDDMRSAGPERDEHGRAPPRDVPREIADGGPVDHAPALQVDRRQLARAGVGHEREPPRDLGVARLGEAAEHPPHGDPPAAALDQRHLPRLRVRADGHDARARLDRPRALDGGQPLDDAAARGAHGDDVALGVGGGEREWLLGRGRARPQRRD